MMGENIGSRARRLWHKVSNDFLHFVGYTTRLCSWAVGERGDYPPPSSAMGAFTEYQESDDPELEELNECVTELNELFNEVTDAWVKNCLLPQTYKSLS